jgi:hypothetical protein
MIKRTNTYDLLGNGMYFWENNYDRALEWANTRYGPEDAEVIGAVIDLGYCLNLTDSASIPVLENGYELLKERCLINGNEMPKNRKGKSETDVLLRDLDCAVIQQIHAYLQETGKQDYDSIRGGFIEGSIVYPGSEFKTKTHVQLCVCNPNCIKGYFSPLSANSKYRIP